MYIVHRARDMVIEQRGHFWGSRGAAPGGGKGGEAPGKNFRALM